MDVDIAVIGGGPAGAHAAYKAALLFRTAALFDKGRKFSRIYWSPRVDNLPGRYGESGRDIVAKGYDIIAAYEKEQGRSFVTVHEDTEVTAVRAVDGGYELTATHGGESFVTTARVVVFATGAVDAQPALREFRRRDIEAVLPYANKGLADYCLLCDGHTVANKRVAVLGCDPGSRTIAKSLKKNFGADTVVVPFCNVGETGKGPANPHAAWSDVESDLGRWEIPIVYGNIASFTGIKDGQFSIVFEDGRVEHFDKAWISMGWYRVNSEAVAALGGALDSNGFVLTTRDCKVVDAAGKPIAGLYAIGDLRADSWKQIPIAWGEAEAAVIDAFVSG